MICVIAAINVSAQIPCEVTTSVSDSLGTYKSTKEYLVYERNFAGKSSLMHFSLELYDGTPVLNLEYVQKSKDFIKANCLDKNSRLYLQLDNGKIITLIYNGSENCGISVRDDKGFTNRIMQGNFLFLKNTIEELKASPISLMRIKFGTETVDYIMKSDLTAEFDGKHYYPQKYFMSTLPCLLN
ncbi:MAG TPA: hypothetical protein VGB43_05315 [Flavobacterium sp.]